MATKRKLTLLLLMLGMGAQPFLHAMDSILLKNGTRITGTILAQSKDRVVMKVGQGNAVYSKKAIQRIYDSITNEPPIVALMRPDELLPWWVPLSDLYSEDWVNTVVNVEATTIDNGNLKYIPYLSFRVNRYYELNIYGDPRKPAAIEIGYYKQAFHGRDRQKHCREFLASYLTTLPQIKTLYALSDKGGLMKLGELTIEVTPPEAPDAYGGWWILVYNPKKIAAARLKTEEEFKKVSAGYVTLMKRSTDGETEWRKWALKDALNRFLPMEEVKEMLR